MTLQQQAVMRLYPSTSPNASEPTRQEEPQLEPGSGATRLELVWRDQYNQIVSGV